MKLDKVFVIASVLVVALGATACASKPATAVADASAAPAKAKPARPARDPFSDAMSPLDNPAMAGGGMCGGGKCGRR